MQFIYMVQVKIVQELRCGLPSVDDGRLPVMEQLLWTLGGCSMLSLSWGRRTVCGVLFWSGESSNLVSEQFLRVRPFEICMSRW